MGFVLNPNRPMEVVVDATITSQQIVNKFYLKAGAGTALGSSDVLLANFRDNYRTNILPRLYDDYIVNNYTLREIDDVVNKQPIGAPARWQNVYNPIGKDVLNGVPVTDAGVLTLGVSSEKLPAHEAIRCKKTPLNYWVGYFKGNYNRFTSWTSLEKHPTSREQWAAVSITSMNAALSAFNLFAMNAVLPGSNPYYNAVWSPQFYGAVVKPGGGGTDLAVQYCDVFVASSYVGTQLTRRYNTLGRPRGS